MEDGLTQQLGRLFRMLWEPRRPSHFAAPRSSRARRASDRKGVCTDCNKLTDYELIKYSHTIEEGYYQRREKKGAVILCRIYFVQIP